MSYPMNPPGEFDMKKDVWDFAQRICEEAESRYNIDLFVNVSKNQNETPECQISFVCMDGGFYLTVPYDTYLISTRDPLLRNTMNRRLFQEAEKHLRIMAESRDRRPRGEWIGL